MQHPLQMYTRPPPERILAVWTAVHLLNYKATLCPVSEDPTKFKEKCLLEATHRDFFFFRSLNLILVHMPGVL